MTRSTIATFAALALSLILVGCSDAAEVPEFDDVPATAATFPPYIPPPCGAATDFLNVPMTLNDGSGTNIPFAGSVPAGNGVTVPILVPAGATLSSITVRVDPGLHTSLNGELLPTLELRKVGQNGVESRVGDIAWDPYAVPGSTWNPGATVAADYSLPHNIVLTLDNVLVTDAFYFLTVSQEWGGGQAMAGVVCGTKMTYSASGL